MHLQVKLLLDLMMGRVMMYIVTVWKMLMKSILKMKNLNANNMKKYLFKLMIF